MIAQDANASEEIWVKRILMGAKQENIFSDNMMGPPGSGRPFIEYDDLAKVDGETIHVPTFAFLGGPGVQGEGERTGNEEKIRPGSFPVTIGRWWHGIGFTDVTAEQTVVGSQLDTLANIVLRQRLGLKKSEDMMMKLVRSAQTFNTVRPNFKGNREALRSNDVFSTSVITRASLVLSSLGGKPVRLGKGEAGDSIEQYLFFGTQWGFASLNNETAYLQGIREARERGETNPLFKGSYSRWDGQGIYRWYVRDGDQYGPVGAAILPRAFLGTAIAANDTLYDIKGGGTIDPPENFDGGDAPWFFQDFSNGAYEFTDGSTLGGDTVTQRYLVIINITSDWKVGFYGFTANNLTDIQMNARLRASANTTPPANSVTTLGNVTWSNSPVLPNGNPNPWIATGSTDGTFAGLTDSHPAGSLILETNSYGVPFCFTLALGEMAGACGHGSLKGRSAIAARTEEHRNHGMDHGIGVETVFGCNPVLRTDGKIPNYVLVESALQQDGLPIVS